MMCELQHQGITSEVKSNKNQIRVLIFETCIFTSSALNKICQRTSGWHIGSPITTFSQLRERLIVRPVDLVIVNAATDTRQMAQLMALQDLTMAKRVVLVSDINPVLERFYLAAGFDYVIDKKLTPNALEQALGLCLDIPTYEQRELIKKRRYSNRERSVLVGLLNGYSQKAIAEVLCIHHKSVSHYKQNALRRAGITRLQDVILGT